MLTCVAGADDVEGEGMALAVPERDDEIVPLIDAVTELDAASGLLMLGGAVYVTLLEPVTELVALTDATRLPLTELDCIGRQPKEGKRSSSSPEQRTRHAHSRHAGGDFGNTSGSAPECSSEPSDALPLKFTGDLPRGKFRHRPGGSPHLRRRLRGAWQKCDAT